MLKTPGASRAILVGTDVPDLNAEVLTRANDVLRNGIAEDGTICDVLFGPACDGGFYLVAASKTHKKMFQDVTWSQSTTLEETIRACTTCSLRVGGIHGDLPRLRDIDTVDDLTAWLHDDNGSVDRGDGLREFIRVAKDAVTEHESSPTQTSPTL